MDKLAFLEMQIEQMHMLSLMRKQAQYVEGNVRERPWIFPLVGAGLGAITGGIAGAAGAKPGKSKLRRALLGAGIGAAGGGAGAYLLRGALTDEARRGLLSGERSAPILSGLTGLGVGAAGGAAAGYGSGKDEATRKRRAIKGALIGGGLGGLLGYGVGHVSNQRGAELHALVDRGNEEIGEALGGRQGGSPFGFPGPRFQGPLFPSRRRPSDEIFEA